MKVIKGEFSLSSELSLSLSLSLCLPSSHKYWTDLIVGGGSAGHPPAGLRYFAGVDEKRKERFRCCHVTGSKISSTIGAVCGNDVVFLTKNPKR
jgi:hypothetical protein